MLLLLVTLIIIVFIIIIPKGPHVNKLHYPIRGIDVSKHTGKVNFEKVKEHHADDLCFVYIKASEGRGMKDSKFEINYKNARKNNIPTGAYHFFRFSVSGQEQADNFLRCIQRKQFDLPMALDVEEWGNSRRKIPTKDIVREIRVFVNIVERALGEKIIFYTNESGYYRFIHNNFDRKIWLCSFDKDALRENDWIFWQYSHTGKLKGADGWVDMNVFNGSKNDWEKLLAK